MSTTTTVSTAKPPADAAPTPLVTSHVLQGVSAQLQSTRHPLVTGAVGDLVLLLGEAMPLPDALVAMASRSFDVVVRVNAADGLCVVHGEEAFGRALGSLDATAEDPVVVVRALLTQSEVSALALVEQADIALQDPAHHDQPDRARVAGLQLALRHAARVGRYRNTCILLAGVASSIPAVLLAGGDELMPVEAPVPTFDERAAYLRAHLDHMAGVDGIGPAGRQALADELARVTEGDRLGTLEALVAFSGNTRHSAATPTTLVQLHRHGVRPNPWSRLALRLPEVRAVLESRVHGQDPAIDAVLSALAGAALGLAVDGTTGGHGGAPRAVLWFVGPTGVGKTELAKAIALAVFGDPDAYVRFDMSTMGERHDAARLLGAPPGYVGHEAGGELTEAVRRRPLSVVLFDEIEKSDPAALDRLMSAIEDGRVTDAQGRVTYFDETIFVFTTNIGAAELIAAVEERGDITYEEAAVISTDAVRAEFTRLQRPEIFGRIGKDGIVPFDLMRPEVVDRVTAKFLAGVQYTNGPTIEVDGPSAAAMVRAELAKPECRALGARQVRNVLVDRLRRATAWIALNGHVEADRVRISFDDDDTFVAVDDGPRLRAR